MPERKSTSKRALVALGAALITISIGLAQDYIGEALREWGLYDSPSKQLETVANIIVNAAISLTNFFGSKWFLLPASFIAGALVFSTLSKIKPLSGNLEANWSAVDAYSLHTVTNTMIYRIHDALSENDFTQVPEKLAQLTPKFKSSLVTLRKQAFPTPNFIKFDEFEYKYALYWLSEINPLLDDGHGQEAATTSAKLTNAINKLFLDRT